MPQTSTSHNGYLPLPTGLSIMDLFGSPSGHNVGSTRVERNTTLINIVNLRGFLVKVKLGHDIANQSTVSLCRN